MSPSNPDDNTKTKPQIVRGPLLTDGPHQASPIGRDSGRRISRADLTDFLLVTATSSSFVRMKPLVSESRN
jgi:hypothetical protein